MALAVARRCVDPALVEEARDDVAGFAGEVGESVEDELLRLRPLDLRRVLGERRHAVVEGKAVEPEQLGLQVCSSAARRRSGRRRRRSSASTASSVVSFDRLRAEIQVRVSTEPVVDRLVDGDRVEDERPRPEAGRERHRDGLGGASPEVAVGRVELRHRLLEADLGSVEVHLDRAEQLVVEPIPGRETGHGLLGEDLLLGLGEHVRPELADRAEPVAPALELVAREERLGLRRPRAPRSRARRRGAACRPSRPSPSGARRAHRAASRSCRWRTTGARSRWRA